MDNLKKLANQFHKFYSLVETHESQVQEWIKETKKPLHSIINQSAILRAAASEDSLINTGLEQFEGFKEALVEIILSSLEEELVHLNNIRDKIGVANESLRKEQKTVETYYAHLRQKDTVNSADINQSCPRFERIVDWCLNIWRYYHSFYLQISSCLLGLNFEDEDSVQNLSKAFQEDLEAKNHVNVIRSFSFSKFDFLV